MIHWFHVLFLFTAQLFQSSFEKFESYIETGYTLQEIDDFFCKKKKKSNFKISEKEDFKRNLFSFPKYHLVQCLLSTTRGQPAIYFSPASPGHAHFPEAEFHACDTVETSVDLDVHGPSLECGPHTFGVDYFTLNWWHDF